MRLATVAVSVVLAALLTLAAVRKLSHQEHVVRSYARVGVPEDKLDRLAIVLLAGAAGLVLGLLWAPIGVAAAIGVVCYFIGAVAFHIRAGDVKNMPTPIVYLATAAVALALHLTRL